MPNPKTCIEEGCERTDITARDLCGQHYQIHRLHGDLDEVSPRYRTIRCKYCGDEFRATQRRAQFCSSGCGHKWRRESQRGVRSCRQCGNPIAGRSWQARFCSDQCGVDYRHVAVAEQLLAKKPPCAECGGPLSLERRKFCSLECKIANGTKARKAATVAKLAALPPCIICGNKVTSTSVRAITCSPACSVKWGNTKKRLEKYHLTHEELIALLTKFDRCGICGTTDFGHYGQAIDHCHDTGRVRGVLCGSCNTALGLFKDSPVILRLAADYLERPLN